MGWHPARDKQNRVIEEYRCFPQTKCDGGSKWLGGPRFIRQTQFGTGGSRDGKGDRRSPAKLLAANAMALGWLNGRRLKKA